MFMYKWCSVWVWLFVCLCILLREQPLRKRNRYHRLGNSFAKPKFWNVRLISKFKYNFKALLTSGSSNCCINVFIGLTSFLSNKLFDLTNQVWRYIVTSNLIGQLKQLVNFNKSLTLTIVYATGSRTFSSVVLWRCY